jgi:hypothetical protein
MKYKFSKTIIILCIVGFFHQISFCQKIEIQPVFDNVVHYSKVKFHFYDSIFPYTLFLEPNGNFYFYQGFVDRPDVSRDRITNRGIYRDVFSPKSNSIENIPNFFPRLLCYDSAFPDNTGRKIIYYTPLVFELRYSYLLHNFHEQSLFFSKDQEAIRMISDGGGESYLSLLRCFSIMVRFENEEATLFCSVGGPDSLGSFKTLTKDSCKLKKHDIKHLKKKLSKIDFDHEKDFRLADMDMKKILEYRNGQNYYAIERSIYASHFSAVYKSLISLSFEYKMIKLPLQPINRNAGPGGR